ncbi:amidase domain-containing protein [Actinoplanes sp. CA-054009]
MERSSESRVVDSATTDLLTAAALQSLEQRVAGIVGTAKPALRPGSLADGQVGVHERQVATEERFAADLLEHRDWLRGAGEGYSGGETSLTVDRVVREGDIITLDADEVTSLAYEKINGDEPPTTAYTAQHSFVFQRAAGDRWELAEDRQIEPTGLLPLPQATRLLYVDTSITPDMIGEPPEGPAQVKAPPAHDEPASVERPAELRDEKDELGLRAYNYGAMATYLERYWKNYNRAYRSFNNVGGDCTNFASQALRAGGWAHDLGWYRSSENWWYNRLNETWSWINVNYWASFAYRYSRRVRSLSNVWQMGRGDVLQVDGNRNNSKDHTMMCSYRSSSGTPYLTYHTSNRYRRSMTLVLRDWGNALYYAGRT